MGPLAEDKLAWVQTVDQARSHTTVSLSAWNAVDFFLGGIGQNLRLFGLIGKEGVEQALKEARITTEGNRPLTHAEMEQVAMVWRIARQKLGMRDEDPTPEDYEALWYQPVGVTAKKSKYLAWSGGPATKPKAPTKRPPVVPPRRAADLALTLERAQRGDLCIKGQSYVDGTDHLRGIFHNGYDGARAIPLARWDGEAYYEPDAPEWKRTAIYTKHGLFTDLPEPVDYTFFGITAADAKLMDPQQRSCLKQGYRAFVSSKMTRHVLRGSLTGVYAGSMNFDFLMDLTGIIDRGNQSMLANRIGCALGLSGPSIYIDTGCSSSLVTADMAATHVRRGKCQAGVALGVCALLSPSMYTSRCMGSLLSRKGRSMSFDNSSDGYVVGEGCGAVVVGWTEKLEDRSPLWIASETMQDGRSAQLTAPSGPAQGELLRNTLRRARITPAEISSSECQCNGSHLGDPIELGSLEKFHRPYNGNREDNALMLVAGKTAKGHGEGNAGMTVMMKTILLLEDHVLPPVLHFKSLNPHIDVEGMPFVFVGETSLLPYRDSVHVAGSAFGWGGVNAHFIWRADVQKQQQVYAQPQYALPFPSAVPLSAPLAEAPKPSLAETAEAPKDVVAAAPAGLEIGFVRAMILETAMNVNDGEPLEMDTSLMESGIDSLAAITFRNELQKKSGLGLKGTLMFDYPTMGAIADHIVELSNG